MPETAMNEVCLCIKKPMKDSFIGFLQFANPF